MRHNYGYVNPSDVSRRLEKIFNDIYSAEVLNLDNLKNEFYNVAMKISKLPKRHQDEVVSSIWNKILKTKFTVKECTDFSKWDNRKMLRNAIALALYSILEGLRTNQLRKFIDMSTAIHRKMKLGKIRDDEIEASILKMRYLLAYQAGKQKSVEKLALVLDLMLQKTTKDNFERFYEFLQAVVAYHKFFGGAD